MLQGRKREQHESGSHPSINQSNAIAQFFQHLKLHTVCSSQAPRPAFLVTVLEHSLPHDLSLDTLRHLPVLQAKQRTAGHLRSRRQQVGRGFHLAIINEIIG